MIAESNRSLSFTFKRGVLKRGGRGKESKGLKERDSEWKIGQRR